MATIRRIRTVFSGVAGTPWYSNMYFTWVNGTEQDALDAVADFWGAIDAQMNNAVDWATEGDIAVIDDATGQITSIESGTGGTGTGAVATALLPPATQGLVHLLTNSFLNGRQVRGRCFVPGLTEADNDAGGVMAAGTQTIIQNAINALIAGSSTPGPLRVFARSQATSVVVQTATVPTKFAVLRSRRD